MIERYMFAMYANFKRRERMMRIEEGRGKCSKGNESRGGSEGLPVLRNFHVRENLVYNSLIYLEPANIDFRIVKVEVISILTCTLLFRESRIYAESLTLTGLQTVNVNLEN